MRQNLKWDEAPNNMWMTRAYGQLAKCAEAQALRKAFPDFVGNEYTKEEMEGKHVTYQGRAESSNNQTVKIDKIEVINTPIQSDFDLDDALLRVSQCLSLPELENLYVTAYRELTQRRDKESLRKLIDAKDKKKSELNMKEFNEEIDSKTGEVTNE